QFSLPFGIAVALARGAASTDEFAPAFLADPLILDLMERVEGVRDAALDAVFPRAWPTWVRVRLRGGRTVERLVEHPSGDPECFPTPDELGKKFRTLADRVLPAAQVERLEMAARGFASVPRVTDLLALTVPPSLK